MHARQLLNPHRPELIDILKNASPAVLGNPEVAAFLNRVLDD